MDTISLASKLFSLLGRSLGMKLEAVIMGAVCFLYWYWHSVIPALSSRTLTFELVQGSQQGPLSWFKDHSRGLG